MASVKDLVCGMMVDSDRAAAKEEYQGQTYYFCSPGCAAQFRAEPTKFVR